MLRRKKTSIAKRSRIVPRLVSLHNNSISGYRSSLHEKSLVRRALPKDAKDEYPSHPLGHGYSRGIPSPVNRSKDTNAEMWQRFDYIGVVCYTGYKDRHAQLVRELERVGILDFNVHWDFPSPYKELLLNKVPMFKWNKTGGGFFIGLNNYRAIATAYNLGCKSCLIMEDDVRLLKDGRILSGIVGTLPSDFDLAMLDHNDPTGDDRSYLKNFSDRVNAFWSKFTMLSSSGCYAMSRAGMKRFLDLYESPLRNGVRLKANDCYFNRDDMGHGMKLYAATTCPCMQLNFNGCHGSQYMDRYYRIHGLLGMCKEMYA